MKSRIKKPMSRMTKPIVAVLCIVAAALFIQPLFQKLSEKEPLADATSLKLLMQGHKIPEPKDELMGEFLGKKVATLPPSSFPVKQRQNVLGVNDQDKRIEVDLTNQ